MPFSVNPQLLVTARRVLRDRPRTYWLLGGAASGKSAVAQSLSRRYDIPVFDMDARLYGSYCSRYTPDRHPANRAWLDSGDALGWQLGMSWEEFDAWTHAANAESLDLLAEELRFEDPAAPLLIDGGFSHPALIAQVVLAERIVCLQGPAGWSEQQWSEVPERRALKDEVLGRPDGESEWQRFLEFDANLRTAIAAEAHASGITLYEWAPGVLVVGLAAHIARDLNLSR